MQYHPHGSVLFITFSMEQGLLMLSNPLCEAIIKIGSCYVDTTGKLVLTYRDGGPGLIDERIGLRRVKVTVRNTSELSFSAEVESAPAYMFPWEAPLEMDFMCSKRKFYKMVDAADALAAKRQQRN